MLLGSIGTIAHADELESGWTTYSWGVLAGHGLQGTCTGKTSARKGYAKTVYGTASMKTKISSGQTMQVQGRAECADDPDTVPGTAIAQPPNSLEWTSDSTWHTWNLCPVYSNYFYTTAAGCRVADPG